MKYKIIHLLFIIGLINFNVVHAFFLVNDRSGEIRIDHTIIDSSTQGNNVFQLYDNFFDINTNSFLVKKIDGFISVDQVKLNIPLKILARGSIYPENSIDRMLVANLRIKSIVSEYRAVQRKAQFMLQGLRVTGLEKKDTRSSIAMKSMNNIESENEKIKKKIFNINRLSSLSLDVDSSNEAIVIKDRSDLQNATEPILKSIFYNTDSLKGKNNNSALLQTNRNAGMPVLIRQENRELPWAFNLFLKILNYVLNNRVEFIFYMTFIAAAGFFISLQMKR